MNIKYATKVKVLQCSLHKFKQENLLLCFYLIQCFDNSFTFKSWIHELKIINLCKPLIFVKNTKNAQTCEIYTHVHVGQSTLCTNVMVKS